MTFSPVIYNIPFFNMLASVFRFKSPIPWILFIFHNRGKSRALSSLLLSNYCIFQLYAFCESLVWYTFGIFWKPIVEILCNLFSFFFLTLTTSIHYYPPATKWQGDIGMGADVRPSVRPSVTFRFRSRTQKPWEIS